MKIKPILEKKNNYHLDEPVAMTKGVVMCEKKNAMVIRAVRIFCFRNKMNIILAFHQYLQRIIQGARKYGIFFECSTRQNTSERSKLVRFLVEHERRNFISASNHLSYCLLYKHNSPLLKREVNFKFIEVGDCLSHYMRRNLFKNTAKISQWQIFHLSINIFII